MIYAALAVGVSVIAGIGWIAHKFSDSLTIYPIDGEERTKEDEGSKRD